MAVVEEAVAVVVVAGTARHLHRGERRQVAAREDVLAYEVGVLVAVRLVPLVGQRDHLVGR